VVNLLGFKKWKSTPDVNKLAHILKQLMDEQDISTSELARRTDIGQPVIHRIISGETGDPKVGTMSAIANYFAVSISQLIGDEPLPKNRLKGTHNKPKFGWSKAPLISWEDVIDWPSNKEKFQELEYLLTDADVSSNVYALKVKDTTMRPLFPEDTILIIDPELEPEDRDYAIAHIDQQKQAIFRQILFDGQQIYLKPLNSEFKITQLENSYKFLGVVVQSRGEFRK
jgi:SOS-response transcriptional repressor LexA